MDTQVRLKNGDYVTVHLTDTSVRQRDGQFFLSSGKVVNEEITTEEAQRIHDLTGMTKHPSNTHLY